MADARTSRLTGGGSAGSNGQLQYNNNGVMGGIANVTTDGTNLTALGLACHAIFNSGSAITSGNYEIGRDNTATNQLYINVPTGAGYRILIGGTDRVLLEKTGHFTFDQGVATSSGSDTGTIYKFKNAANTALSAGTETIQMDFDFSSTQTHATGAITTQRDVVIRQTTHAFAGASQITFGATHTILGGPIAGANAQIVYGVSQYLPTWSSNTNSSVTQFITPPGIANGKGATAFLVGTLLGSLTGQIEVGDQTAVTTMFAGLYVSGFGLNSTTNVRSFTTAASVYIEGPPTNNGNVTFLAGSAYSLLVNSGKAKFGGGVYVAGDGSGEASTTSFTNVTNTTLTNAYVIKGGQAAATANTGWLKIYVGTNIAWIPYVQNATP